MKFAMFVLGAGVAAAFGLFVLPYLGLFPFAATGGPNIIDWWGDTNFMHALEREAPEGEEAVSIPDLASGGEGFGHYRESCVLCHGAPEVEALEWTKNMEPQPPKLWEEDSQSLNDGELFLVVREGIRMTGMPAFGPEHTDEEIWDIVAFLRTLNNLNDNENQMLTRAIARVQGEGHHDEGAEGGMDHEEGKMDKGKAGENDAKEMPEH